MSALTPAAGATGGAIESLDPGAGESIASERAHSSRCVAVALSLLLCTPEREWRRGMATCWLSRARSAVWPEASDPTERVLLRRVDALVLSYLCLKCVLLSRPDALGHC